MATSTLAVPSSPARRVVVAGVLSGVAIFLGYTRLGFIPVPSPAGNATIMHIPAIIGGVLEGWGVGAVIGAIFGLFSFLQSTTQIFKDPLVAILPRIFIGITPFFVYRALRGINRTGGYIVAALILVLVGVFAKSALDYIPPQNLAFNFGGTDANQPWISLTGQSAIVLYDIIGGLMVLLGIGLAGAFAYYAHRNQMEIMAIGAAAVVGTLTNTVLVLTMIVVRGYLDAATAVGIGITNGIPEIIVAVIITVAVVTAWKGIGTGAGKSSV
ncbi:MAG: ECF transporter S component [Anaerolineae bacterium]